MGTQVWGRGEPSRPALKSTRHDGVPCVLMDASGNPVAAGEEHTDFRGEIHTVVGGRAPQRSNSTGRVWVKVVTLAGDRWVERTREYFPSVLNLHWEPIT